MRYDPPYLPLAPRMTPTRPILSHVSVFLFFFSRVFERVFDEFWHLSGAQKLPKIAPLAEKVCSETGSVVG